MTAPTINGTRYPQPVDELLPAARDLAEQLGAVPSRNRLMREYRIGAPKAGELLARLRADADEQARVETLRAAMAARGGLPPVDIDQADDEQTVEEPADVDDTPASVTEPEPDEPPADPWAHAEPIVPDPAPEPAPPAKPTEPDPVAIDPDPGPAGTDEPDPADTAAHPPAEPDAQPSGHGHPGTPHTAEPDRRNELRSLTRVRWAVRGVLALGVAASIAGNVLHARDDLISQIISAWSPLALLLTIELISRVPVHRRHLALARWAATAVIAGIAAWVSYWHMAAVAARYGETNGSQYLLPLSVDGLVVVASICLVELGGRIAAATKRR